MNLLRIGSIAIAASLGACETAPAVRTFPEPPEKVRKAVLEVLSRCQDVREEGDLIRSGDCPSPLLPGIPKRFGRWRERHEVLLDGSTVEVRSVVEEGVGRRGRSWDRRPSRYAQDEFLEAVTRALKENP